MIATVIGSSITHLHLSCSGQSLKSSSCKCLWCAQNGLPQKCSDLLWSARALYMCRRQNEAPQLHKDGHRYR